MNVYMIDNLLKYIYFTDIQIICYILDIDISNIKSVNRILFKKFNKNFIVINSNQYDNDNFKYIENMTDKNINNNHIIINDNSLTPEIFLNILLHRYQKYFNKNNKDYIVKFVFILNNVVKLNENIFEDNNSIISVSLPITLKRISNNSFKNTNIKKIYLPFNLKYIGYNSFSDMYNLKKINIPYNIKTICNGAITNTSIKYIVIRHKFKKNIRNIFYKPFCNKINHINIKYI